ncbi:Chemotaxis protein cheW [Candidatus Terasakiella magnetica]|uniref:Chemotaxis protein cheW n=1 Tax=Candidatus Terasakiella magnetica TaxID=1867952 RepID=A0A1C3RC48_9PROT|nr:chemotaxis protein CheW [Candidatus Terasakiella magnetica]SCA54853.1 Chemotaxis protein cheW [Candidatus Terasakiella magnetica]
MASTDNNLMPSVHENGELQNAGEEVNQFITFTIGEEEYGVDIMAVREIKAWTETTHLPNTPEFMRGVLNLRGLIVPIFDLRCRFGMGLTEATKMHVVVIVQVQNRMVGILVDTVSDIISISQGDIQEVPKMDRNIDDEYLSGLVTVKTRMVALLDVDLLFNPQAIETGIALGEAAVGDK